MTPEQNRNGFPVEIKELKEDGLSDEPIKFASYTELDKFTHRQSGYIYAVVKRSKQGKRKRKYIISSPAFEHGRRVHDTYYVIAKINGEKVADKDDPRATICTGFGISPDEYGSFMCFECMKCHKKRDDLF